MSAESMMAAAGMASAATGAIDNDDAVVVLGNKLLVHVAENGHSYEFECDGRTAVSAIQSSIECHCGIPVANQLLLCGSVSLASSHSLAAYNLPHDDREVFVFNKSRLQSDAPVPPPEAIDLPEPILPPPLPQELPASLTSAVAADPALNALASYEHQFRYHFQLANTVYQSSKSKFELCKRLLREQQVQERALDTVRVYLAPTFRRLEQRFTEFAKCFDLQNQGHTELLRNFNKDLERLRAVVLHPALRAEGRTCLADMVKENELAKWAGTCAKSHWEFEAKVLELKKNFIELKRRVESLFVSISSGSCKVLEQLIREHQRVINDQTSIMQTLSKDVETSKKRVDDCSSGQLSASLRPHDAVSAVGRMYEVHVNDYLPKMRHAAHIVSTLLEKCKAKKNEMNILVHTSMQRVKSVQISIRDMTNELHALQEVMGHQDSDFESLKIVSRVGQAYRACLAEVVRRRSAFKLYMGLAGQLAEKLAAERESEISRRDFFMRTWSKFIPSDVLRTMGLFDYPSQCDVSVASFDGDLLQLDLDDVNRLAPQALVGVLPSSDMPETSESLLLSGDKNVDLNELLTCDGGDISGTSKLEVENAQLKAKLASALVEISSFRAAYGYEPMEKTEMDDASMRIKDEALRLKDEYANQLNILLKARIEQCVSLEKRVKELEQKLAEQYVIEHRSAASAGRGSQAGPPTDTTMDMEEVSSTSRVTDPRVDKVKHLEGGDENMTDLLLNIQLFNAKHDISNDTIDVLRTNEHKAGEEMSTRRQGETNVDDHLNGFDLDPVSTDHLVLDTQSALAEKSKKLDEAQSKVDSLEKEVISLREQLEESRKRFEESQMNCAHLENCLHEAREEARKNESSALRRSTEYDALRSSVLKIHGLFERLQCCVTAPTLPGFVDSIQSLACSFASSAKKDESDSTLQFQQCIQLLAEKVGFLSQQNARVEAAQGKLLRELEEKKELVKNLYTKHQLEKQASKEKISFGRFEVHELAAFVRNSSGHYEAINRHCPNYYLSEESIALFAEQHVNLPTHIIGQIVHIERCIVRLPLPRLDFADQMEGSFRSHHGNPYSLPVGCEYFLVTVAMLPEMPDNTSFRNPP